MPKNENLKSPRRSLCVSDELWEKMRMVAAADGRTLSSWIRVRLEEALVREVGRSGRRAVNQKFGPGALEKFLET